MMRLSTMWNVDRTVRADGSSPVAERVLERWPHDPGSVRFFRSTTKFALDLLDRTTGSGLDIAIPAVFKRGTWRDAPPLHRLQDTLAVYSRIALAGAPCGFHRGSDRTTMTA